MTGEVLATGLAHFRAGRLDEAERIFRQILDRDPRDVRAWHLLGLVAKQRGELPAAMECLKRAIELAPEYAEARCDLGNCWKELGNPDEAEACYRGSLEFKPELATGHLNLGILCEERGAVAEAASCYRRAVGIDPTLAAGHHALGTALLKEGKYHEAAESFRCAVFIAPQRVESHCQLGNCLALMGELGEAFACYQRVAELKPWDAGGYHNLGTVLHTSGAFREAIGCYEQALRLQPNMAEAHVGLGAAWQMLGDGDRAIAAYERALSLNGAIAEAHNNLGNALKDQGRLDEALAAYQRAVEVRPDYASAAGNRLYLLQFSPRWDAEAICEEHRRWNAIFAAPLEPCEASLEEDMPWHGLGDAQKKSLNPRPFRACHPGLADPERRLRVGYVSPDFRNHCQSFFTLPLFEAHDRDAVEVYCYSDVLSPDATTERVARTADAWRKITGLSDAAVAQLVREDGIDILVDLTMHMERNRLIVFARKPAPVQVTWLAYPGTTGLAAMDYRLTDPYLDPPGMDASYVEKSIRLADSFWCYQPLGHEPEIGELPAWRNGYVTFGSLNNFCKVNDEVLRLWARVMMAVGRSRLMLMAPEGSVRERTLGFLEREGVLRERVMFVGKQPLARYFELYREFDVGLDTFPYNGHTTSLDSYWMGVPVVTLVGQTLVGRAGLSQLTNLGLAELVARTEEEFVAIAAGLAGNLGRAGALRASLRERMRASVLMDAGRFARSVEEAYRGVWRDWCAGR